MLTIGERLDDLMKEKGFTDESLAEEINKRNDPRFPTISKSTISEIKNNATNKNGEAKGFNYRYFIALADVFGVSVDYLLCCTDVKPLDNKLQAAADVTGLSEKAINNLIKCKYKNNVYWHGEIANSIIESDEFLDIVVFLKKAVIEKDSNIDYDIYKVSTKDIGKTKAVESFHSLIAALDSKYKDFITPYRYDLSMASSIVYSLYESGKINNDELTYLLREFEKGNFELANKDLDQIRQIMKERRKKNGKHN